VAGWSGAKTGAAQRTASAVEPLERRGCCWLGLGLGLGLWRAERLALQHGDVRGGGSGRGSGGRAGGAQLHAEPAGEAAGGTAGEGELVPVRELDGAVDGEDEPAAPAGGG
jgi:hypothetical protein